MEIVIIIIVVVLVIPAALGIFKGLSMAKQEVSDMEVMRKPKNNSKPTAPTENFLNEQKHQLNASAFAEPIDHVSQKEAIQTQIKILIDESVNYSLRILTKHKEHAPFAILLHSNGDLQCLISDESNSHIENSSNDLLVSIENAAAKIISEGSIKAAAIVHHRLEKRSEGNGTFPIISIQLDYRGGTPKQLSVPYVRKAGDLLFAFYAAVDNESKKLFK